MARAPRKSSAPASDPVEPPSPGAETDPAPQAEAPSHPPRVLTVEDVPENAPWAKLSRRLRAEMGEPLDPTMRTMPPPGMTVGFSAIGRKDGIVATRIFAVPGGSCVELAETRDVPRDHWEAEATKDAWAWYDYWAPAPVQAANAGELTEPAAE